MSIDLEAIRKRAEAATPGPWKHWHDRVGQWVRQGEQTEMGAGAAVAGAQMTRRDAEFIAHARTDITALLTLVEELTKERDEVWALYHAIDRKFAPYRTMRAERDEALAVAGELAEALTAWWGGERPAALDDSAALDRYRKLIDNA